MKRVLLALGLEVCVSACSTSNSSPSPTVPSPSTTTRVISLSGNMAFGNIQVGTTFTATLDIRNGGNSTLTVTGITSPTGYTEDWTSGTISAGGVQTVTVKFSPLAEQPYNGTLTINGDQTSGTNTIAISGTGTGPPGPRTTFGDGQYLVGSDITAGRYYSAPLGFCYWERLSGLGRGETIASRLSIVGAAQWIVDIAASDKAFTTEGCGIWSMTPKAAPASGTITAGMWLTGSQIAPGTYSANAQSRCYWERLRNFGGTLSDIIANNRGESGSQLVTIAGDDAGFNTDANCGTWTRVSSLTSVFQDVNPQQSPPEIQHNWDMHHRQNGIR